MAWLASNRLRRAELICLIVVPLGVGACDREPQQEHAALGSSLIFDDASPEAREALASAVDFRINDDNFARWEKAERNLEALPRSALPAKSPAGGNVVDRAVARLESSPYTRTAIERTGLSVKDFVLETIALAQATEAARTGKSVSRGRIPPENFQFVQRYTSRALYTRSRAARGNADGYDRSADVDVMSQQAETDSQMRSDEAERQEEMRQGDVERGRVEVDRATEARRGEAERGATRDPPPPARDTAPTPRDTLITPRW